MFRIALHFTSQKRCPQGERAKGRQRGSKQMGQSGEPASSTSTSDASRPQRLTDTFEPSEGDVVAVVEAASSAAPLFALAPSPRAIAEEEDEEIVSSGLPLSMTTSSWYPSGKDGAGDRPWLLLFTPV